MASMFADIDFKAAQIVDNTLPNDKYSAIVSTAEIKKTEKGKTGFNLAFTIVMGKYAGRQIFDWSEVPSNATEGYSVKTGVRAGTTVTREENLLSLADRLKTKLAGLGVPEDQMDKLDSDDLIGRKVIVTTRQEKNDPERSRIVKIEPASFSDSDVEAGEVSAAPANPFL